MPTRPDHDELDNRKAAILRSVVTGYVETAQPVGSSQVARDPVIEVSPATVRADMAALEREGYLTHPHTSAGRIPTDKGYRFFVDHLGNPQPLARPRMSRYRSSSRRHMASWSGCSRTPRVCLPSSPTAPESS